MDEEAAAAAAGGIEEVQVEGRACGSRRKVDYQVEVVRGHEKLRHSAGKISIQRGPLVYCIEQADNGEELHNIRLDSDAEFRVVEGEGMFAGKTLLQAPAIKAIRPESNEELYRYNAPKTEWVSHPLTLIPYFTWANRGEGEMRVWITEKE